VDGIESDLRLDADGDLVLVHDRVLPDGRAVASLSRRKLADALGRPVATAREAIDAFPSLLWDFEVKSRDVLPPLLALLAGRPPGTRVLVTSFHHDLIERLGPIPGIRRGVLVAHRPFRVAGDPLGWWPRSGGPDAIVWAYETLDDEAVRAAAARGVQSLAYGPLTREEHERCRALGLEGVVTDHPALLL
jgi:glycerophosphoryl diester phosphodiesterase